MTVGNTAVDPRFQRVGVISPNLAYGLDWPADSDDGEAVWPLESIAKKVSLLFDRIYLTHDLDVTCEIVGGYAENTETATLRYLAERGLLFRPQELGYDSGDAFVSAQTTGTAAALHRRLIRAGNPYMNEEPGETKYIGQPDIGDIDASNGWHPRSRVGWNDPKIETRKKLYESLLMRRTGRASNTPTMPSTRPRSTSANRAITWSTRSKAFGSATRTINEKTIFWIRFAME
jgi:hypothetical protein